MCRFSFEPVSDCQRVSTSHAPAHPGCVRAPARGLQRYSVLTADLRPVLTAPNLTNLTVYDLPALDPDSWRDTCIGWLAQGKPPFWE
jgi:hypothetical protein